MTIRALNRRKRQVLARPRVLDYSTPSPAGGWNARDAWSEMDEGDAITLDNWFPEESLVRVRRGNAEYASGIGGTVESLMAWTGPSSAKLFGAGNSKIFDISTTGAVGAADISSLSNDRWQHTNFGNSSGAYLYIVNGDDAPRYYDGSSWTTPTITGSGLTASDLIDVHAFKQRLFFIEKNTLNFWYFPVETLAGSISKFDLSAYATLGGYLVAMGTWGGFEGGTGPNALAVFVTSKGQVIVFAGTDPGDSSAWALVNVYRIGAPIGRRCLTELGGELIVVTEDGFSQISRFVAAARASDKAAMSDKISGAVNESVRDHRTRFGWQPIYAPSSNMVLFNIPRGATSHQYVSNSTTGAWCRFTGWNAHCWEVYNDQIYFGRAGGYVNQADTGLDDDGSDIQADAKTAFSYFRHRGREKIFDWVRPNFIVDGAISAGLQVNTDYADQAPTSTPTFTPSEGAEWDVGVWDVAEWGEGQVPSNAWQSISGIGTVAALRLRTLSQNGTIKWASNDFKYQLTAPGHI